MRWFGNPKRDAQTLNQYFHFCEGDPNGQIVAPPGAFCLNTLGGANVTWWVKEANFDNTGWVPK